MLQFILASSNPHKAQELSELFDWEVLTVESAKEKLDVVEDGETFHDNAFLKAKAYFEKFKLPVVADDSGLNVDALPNDLGVQTARFGGEKLTTKERYELLLKTMKDIPEGKRGAHFVCVLCFYLSPEEVYFFEGKVDGAISFEAKGDQGFGYDPVFIPTSGPDFKSTLAMIPEWKEKNSHRSRAADAAQKFFQRRVCQKG